MDIFTHILTGVLIGLIFHGAIPYFWIPAIIGAILPDLIGEVGYQIGRIYKGKKIKLVYDKEVSDSHSYLGGSTFLFPYNLMHSLSIIPFLFLFSLPYDFIAGYLSHLLLDIVSHAKNTWGIMVFWPFSKKKFGVKKDWWEWKVFKKIKGLFD